MAGRGSPSSHAERAMRGRATMPGRFHLSLVRVLDRTYEALARYSSTASSGMWAIPLTIRYLICLSRTSRRSSCVGTPRRLAASGALRSSTRRPLPWLTCRSTVGRYK
jgi:hypothetical protein